MDDEAAILLARTHATLVRQLSEVAGHHFEGLQAAARYKSLNLTNRQRRQLCHLDIAFSTGRGTSPPWSAPRSPLRSWNMCHQCLPRHALRLLRVHQFKNKMSSPLRRIHRSVFNRAPRRTNCTRASPSDTGASDRAGNSRGSSCQADPGEHCGDHSTGACSAAHRWTNCVRASPCCAGANVRAGKIRGSGYGTDPGTHCGVFWSGGAWSVATRLVDGSIRTSGFLMMLSLIAAPRLLIHVYGIEKFNLSTKSSWTKCWHEEPWWSSDF